MTLVDGLGKQGVLIQSFWFTHYVCFCAITVVYIYTIQQYRLGSSAQTSSEMEDPERLRFLFGLAESCQQHLAEATRKNCPSRRYSIILEELRLEVHRQFDPQLCPDASTAIPGYSQAPATGNPPSKAENKNVDLTTPSLYGTLPATYMNYNDGLPTDGLIEGNFESDEDFGLLDNLEGSIWWTQLDSWVSLDTRIWQLSSDNAITRPFRISRMTRRTWIYDITRYNVMRF